MEKIEINKTIIECKYKAIDGTLFDKECECESYEKTASVIMQVRYKKLVIKSINEYDLLSNFAGSEDYIFDFVKVSTNDDINTIAMYSYYINGSIMSEKELNILEKAKETNQVALIGTGYNTDSIYCYGLLEEVKNNIIKNFIL